GQIDLVRAMADLTEVARQRVRVFIVGDRQSTYSRALHRAVAQLPLSLRLRLVVQPETGDVAPYYKMPDIALGPRRIESYPRVVLEAMAAGLPVITTPVFGIREQVRENVNGLFYEPGDASALAAALSRLVENAALRAALADNSRPVLDSLV